MIASCAAQFARSREHGCSVAQHAKAEEPLRGLRGAIVKVVVPSATELECFGKAKLFFGRNLEGSLIRPNVER